MSLSASNTSSTIRFAGSCGLSGRVVSAHKVPLSLWSSLSDCLLVDIKLQPDDDCSFSVNEHCLNIWVEIRCLNVLAFYYIFTCPCPQAKQWSYSLKGVPFLTQSLPPSTYLGIYLILKILFCLLILNYPQ